MNNICTHSEYYGKFVSDYVKQLVRSRFGARITQSEDPNFNDIELISWDNFSTQNLRLASVCSKFKAFGDYATLAGLVCVAKEAARQIREESAAVSN